MKDWKTTVAGALSAFALTTGPLAAFLGSIQNIEAQLPGHAPADYRLAIAGAALTCAAAIARVWVGFLMHDAQPSPPLQERKP